jgi:hypothetical protein
MSEIKHTPGPWRMTATGLSRYIDAPIRPGVLQEVAWCGATEEPGQMEANARLISAAPELLAALRFFVEHPGVWQLCTPDSKAMELSRAAIAKATGAA